MTFPIRQLQSTKGKLIERRFDPAFFWSNKLVLVTGLISINVFMFYYMEARRLENEKNNFKAKNIIDLKVSTTTTTEKPICQHNTVWIGDGQCDDILNIENCNYDGGDCCLSADKIDVSFCVECFCHITELKGNF